MDNLRNGLRWICKNWYVLSQIFMPIKFKKAKTKEYQELKFQCTFQIAWIGVIKFLINFWMQKILFSKHWMHWTKWVNNFIDLLVLQKLFLLISKQSQIKKLLFLSIKIGGESDIHTAIRLTVSAVMKLKEQAKQEVKFYFWKSSFIQTRNS